MIFKIPNHGIRLSDQEWVDGSMIQECCVRQQACYFKITNIIIIQSLRHNWRKKQLEMLLMGCKT